MSTNSSLDLQRFYPEELEIVSIEEDEYSAVQEPLNPL